MSVNVVIAHDRFSAAECDELIEAAYRWSPVERSSDTDDQRRRRSLLWQLADHDPLARRTRQRLWDAMLATNAQWWKFDLRSLQCAWVLEFDTGDTIEWHLDRNGEPTYKMSCSVLLSDPADYEGGTLEVLVDTDSEVVQAGRGEIVVFPSWLLHCVDTVTAGCRHSLVGWADGPAFR